jgi:hypothetical protein
MAFDRAGETIRTRTEIPPCMFETNLKRARGNLGRVTDLEGERVKLAKPNPLSFKLQLFVEYMVKADEHAWHF